MSQANHLPTSAIHGTAPQPEARTRCRKIALLVGVLASLCASDFGALTAQSSELRPEGWAEAIDGETLIFEAPDGAGDVRLRLHPDLNLDSIALDVLAQDRPRLVSPRGDTEQQDGEGLGRGYMDTDTNPWMMYHVFVYPHADGGAVSIYSRYPVTAVASASKHQAVVAAAKSLAERGDPLPLVSARADDAQRSEATSSWPPPDSDPVQESETVEESKTASGSSPDGVDPTAGPALQIEEVVFDLDYVYGFGGAATPQYEPVYLMADGRACQCPSYAPNRITNEVLGAVEPGRRGRWRRQGDGYVITYEDDSDPEEVKGTLSRPTPLPRPEALTGQYQAIGGGGNVALGGTVMAAQVEDLTFFPDGSFSQANFSFGSTTFSTAWSKRGKSGNWSLDGPTLTLEFRDGTVVRTSLFYSEKRGQRNGDDPFGVLWIGGESFRKR